MSILSLWRRLFGGPGPDTYYPGGLTPPPFFNCGVKTWEQIEQALQDNIGLQVQLLADAKFQVTDLQHLREYVEWWHFQHKDWMTYDPEYRDCDDFAAAFQGDISKWAGWSATPNAIVWSAYLGGHAYNLHICYEALGGPGDPPPVLRVYLIEPQEGWVWECAPEHFEEYAPWLIMINGKASP